MGEWKRVFLSPRRLLLLLLFTLLSAFLFFFSLLDRIEANQSEFLSAAAEYASGLIEEWKDLSLAELSEAYQEERQKYLAFTWWVAGMNGYSYGNHEDDFESFEEAAASVPRLGYLISCAWDYGKFGRADRAISQTLVLIGEEIDYLGGYYDYLASIRAQADLQSQVSIFNQGSGFSGKNLQKTANDFDGLGDIKVEFGNNIGIEKWLSFKFADYIFLVAIIVFVFAFLEERKKGLWGIVRSCKDGRARLGLDRIGILTAASALCAILIYGLTFIMSLSIYGGWSGLGRSLQSLESFRTCTVSTSISGWLLYYFFLKIVSGVFTGLFFWCVLGSISNIQFSLSALGVILVGEYLLYVLLPVQSVFNILKYFNIFSFVHISDLYTNYFNINLFGTPVGIRPLMLITLLAATVVSMGCAILIQAKRRPEGNRDILSGISAAANRVLDFFRVRLSIGGWEIYKTLIFEYVVIIGVFVVILSQSLTHVVGIYRSSEPEYDMYLQDLQGPIDDRVDEYFVRARRSASESFSSQTLLDALDRLESEVEKVKSDAAAGGYEPWLVDENHYISTYSTAYAQYCQRRTACVAIVFLIFCCAGIAAYENHTHVTGMVRSLKRGRSGLFARKVLVSAAAAVFVWATVFLHEYRQFMDAMRPVTLPAPVQNIAALAQFPARVTFAQYLMILYAVRLVMLILLAFVILLISSYSANIQMAYVLNIGILGFPAMLSVLGLDVLNYISPLVPISSAELMWRLGSGQLTAVMPWAVWMVVGIVSLVLARRKWVK